MTKLSTWMESRLPDYPKIINEIKLMENVIAAAKVYRDSVEEQDSYDVEEVLDLFESIAYLDEFRLL